MDLMTLVAKFQADTSGFIKGVNQAADTMNHGKAAAEKLDATLGKLKTAFGAVVSVAAVAKVTSAVKGLADATASAADRIDKNSQALGMSRKAYQQWDYILGQSGASIDSLGVSMKTLNSAILNPTDGTKEALNTLGLSIGQLQGLSQEDSFEVMVRQFQKLPEGARKSALALQLFGRQGQELMPLLNSSEGTIDELRQSMEKMGFTMSDSMVDAGVKYGDTLDNLRQTFGGLKNIIGYGLMEPLTGIMEEITNFFSQENVQDAIRRFSLNIHKLGNVVLTHVQEFFEWLSSHATDIETIVNNVGEFVSDMSGIILPALGAYAAFKLITNPIALISAGVAAIAANWPTIKEFFTSKVPDWVNQTFGIDLSEIKLPDAAEVVEKVKNWWNGGEEGGGAKEKVAAALQWWLEVPGEPQGDPVEVVKAWWENTKQKVQAVITWALSLPTAPREGGMHLRIVVAEWWKKQVTKLKDAVKWVLNLPNMPEVSGENGIVEKIKKWWSDSVVPALNGVLEFALGFLGLPDEELTVQNITEWWESVINSLGEMFSEVFGVDLPDFETVVSNIKAWWDDALTSLGEYIQATFDIELPDASEIIAQIRNWWDGIVSRITLWLPSWMGGSGGSSSGGTLDRQGGADRDRDTGSVRRFNAAGLDYVPRNGYGAVLHEGEAVLNKRDAEEWRRGGNRGATASEIAEAVMNAFENMAVLMDGSQVGRLTAKTVGRELERDARAGRFAVA